MPQPSHLFFTVTNDLNYDQRMQRICRTLATAGYKVTLIGRKLPDSQPLLPENFAQRRIKCKNSAGKLFYLEYNLRMARYLKKIIQQEKKEHPLAQMAICAIDLDTILPCYRLSKRFNLPRVYDAHEYFTEMTEVKRRPVIYRIWKLIEQVMVPRFEKGYTVNKFIADEFRRTYGVVYSIVRNLPKRLEPLNVENVENFKNMWPQLPERFFLYQGAVNEGRAFEWLIPAMKQVSIPLVIAGKGNFYQQTRDLVIKNGLVNKVIFLGAVLPEKLRTLTPLAVAGITLFIPSGINQYNSLANRFFDYIQAGIPQLCMNYPEYSAVNEQFRTALLIDDLKPETIAAGLNELAENDILHRELSVNCLKAAKALCWENEADTLVSFWKNLIPVYGNIPE